MNHCTSSSRPRAHQAWRNPQVRLLSSLLAAVVSLGFPLAASAQSTVRDTGFRRDVIVDESLLSTGRWEAALTASGGWAFSSVSSDAGEATQNSVYVTPSLVIGRMFTDALELRVSVGVLYLRTSIGSDALTQDHFSGQGAVQALYHVPLALGLALYAGIGLGGYYGFQDRPGVVGRVRFIDAGFLGQVVGGLLVQPGSSLFLRGGLRADVLAGAESPEDPMLGAVTSTFNFLLNAELSVGFRFN